MMKLMKVELIAFPQIIIPAHIPRLSGKYFQAVLTVVKYYIHNYLDRTYSKTYSRPEKGHTDIVDYNICREIHEYIG